MAKSNAKIPANSIATEPAKESAGALSIVWIVVLVIAAYLMFYNSTTALTDDQGNEIEAPESASFSFENWLSGVYQENTEKYLKNNTSIGTNLIWKKNFWDYKYFHKLNLNDYMIGKDDWVLGVQNLDAYYGRDFLGDSVINEKLRKVRVLQDTLSRKGIDIVLLYVPNKEQIYPEQIPDAYRKYTKKRTNLETFVKYSNQYHLNYINFLPFYEKLKPASKYPLYPQYGSHWSYYSECLATDTVIRYIEKLKGVEMPHLTWNDVTYPSDPRVRDADAINKSGLRKEDRPIGFPMAYPNITYSGSPNARPLKTLGIGDSYYRGFQYLGVMEMAFDKGEYWYYYNTVAPETKPSREVWEYDLKQ